MIDILKTFSLLSVWRSTQPSSTTDLLEVKGHYGDTILAEIHKFPVLVSDFDLNVINVVLPHLHVLGEIKPLPACISIEPDWGDLGNVQVVCIGITDLSHFDCIAVNVEVLWNFWIIHLIGIFVCHACQGNKIFLPVFGC